MGNTPNEKNGMKEIAPQTFEVEGKDLAQAVGKALGQAQTLLYGNSVYDTPTLTIADVELTPSQAKKVKVSFYDFTLNFPVLREHILGQLAFTSEDNKAEYIRRTDRNGVFKNTKSFSDTQVAAQIKEHTRLTTDVVKWAKADAKESVVPEELAQRREIEAEKAKIKRIAIKQAAAQLSKAIAAKAETTAE